MDTNFSSSIIDRSQLFMTLIMGEKWMKRIIPQRNNRKDF